ncbi:hypothetical protein HJG60_003918 [Phyllostomus discolor]|nr:hypothetical protein HJG60_003917 [Phyllostomus discolor]KAF6090310.1 hypothetical protein HJG60_003918 [Phyllostomus discolor]
MKSGAAPPRDHSFVNKLATEEGVLTGKENAMAQLKAHACENPREALSRGTLLMDHSPNCLSLSWTPAPLKTQPTISASRNSHRTHVLIGTVPQLLTSPWFLPPQSGSGSWRRPRHC